MDLFWGAGCARPRPIPAAESALGLRSRSALSSAQVLPEWTTSTSPCNNLLSNGDNPLNSLSHSKGSLQDPQPSHPPLSSYRHWRNIRTITLHNPVAYKARVIGQNLLHGTPIPANAYF